jgi:serine/threonine-protein kinase
MAVIAFECVCGRRPFESEAMGSLVLEVCAKPLPVPSRIAGVPPGFDAWWGRAAAREPAARFQSAKELAEALRAVLAPDLAFSGQYRPSAEVVAAATAVGLRGGGAPARDPARPPAPAMGTARAVVSAVQQPSAVRARSQRRAFLAAMALGSLVSAGALVALWRTGHGVAPEPVAPERPAPAAEGAPAAAAEQGAAAPPAAEPAAPAPPEAEPAAPALPAPEPAASAPLAATAAPSATTAAARATSAAPHRPAGPGGTKRKDRLGF